MAETEERRMSFEIGTQIAYIPMHAAGDVEHPDVEFGFVTSLSDFGDPFCRYYHKHDRTRMRTTANSECTPKEMVVEHEFMDQAEVDRWLEEHYGVKHDRS